MIDAKAQDFTLPATGGCAFRLSAQVGKVVVIYFYPKDSTPGCTTEAQQFRDLHPQFVGPGPAEAEQSAVVGKSAGIAARQRPALRAAARIHQIQRRAGVADRLAGLRVRHADDDVVRRRGGCIRV